MERQSIAFAASTLDHSLLVVHLSDELTESGLEVQAFAVPLIARRKGMMIAMPIGLLKQTVLTSSGPIDDEALLGPSRSFEVDLLVEDETSGTSYPSGARGEVLVVDFSNDILPFLRDYDPVTDSTEEIACFDDHHPNAIPAAADLLNLVLMWAETDTASRTHFYSARDEPMTKQPSLPKKAPAKRMTTAALAD